MECWLRKSMMKRYMTYIKIAGIFMALSGLIYFIHYLIFRDPHHIFIYMIGDLAFLPLEVFIVVIVIERLLARREKQAIWHKLNMVVGAFFSEVGNHLLDDLFYSIENRGEIRQLLAINQNWTSRDFKQAAAHARALNIGVDCRNTDLDELKTFLLDKRSFLLGLLENPNLLEYEKFTDLLWAVFHLAEELEARPSFAGLPKSDLEHLSNDTRRAYVYLAAEWLSYIEHLKKNYPFLFSLVMRMHPFQEHPSPIVK